MSKPSNKLQKTETKNTTNRGFHTGWLISGEICFAAVLLFFANQPFDFSDTAPAPAPALIVAEIPPENDTTNPATLDEFGIGIRADSDMKTAASMQVATPKIAPITTPPTQIAQRAPLVSR